MKIWDGFVRFSHWLIALLIISSWTSAHYGDIQYQWHFFTGYTLLTFILSRIIWAFVGSTTARISHFMTSPLLTVKYFWDLFNHKEKPVLGHNPAGGWMVVILWLVLLSQVTTGLFCSDDILVDGPLSYLVSTQLVSLFTTLHHQLFNLLVILISLHIVAVFFHQLIRNEKIIEAMIHGRKQIPNDLKGEYVSLSFCPAYLAALIILIVATVIGSLIVVFT